MSASRFRITPEASAIQFQGASIDMEGIYKGHSDPYIMFVYLWVR